MRLDKGAFLCYIRSNKYLYYFRAKYIVLLAKSGIRKESIMFGFKLLGNTHIPHNKNTKDMPPERMTPPREVLLLTLQHIGAAAEPVVKVGDEVKVGQLIAEATGYVSAPVHSSVSGKVTKIDSVLLPSGAEAPAIRIESDGLMTVSEEVAPPEVYDLDSFLLAVKNSGIVGLGGAGFPTSVKLDAIKKGNIHTVVINGAECEPYITSDMRTMLDSPELIFEGISLLERYAPDIKKFVFGIEKNKPECIRELARVFQDNAKVSVMPLPTLYPQGAEKIMVHNTVGVDVPVGKIPADVGVIVINVTTLAEVARYIKTGMPLVERCVTVDGDAVKSPKNLLVPVGVSVREMLEYVGVDTSEVGKLLFGGPMMGTAICSLDEPLTKKTNAITVMSHKSAREKEANACIHCGRCVSACPMNLNPTAFASAIKIESTEEKIAKLEEYSVSLCMECGCCSYVCPASRPLVQNNRLGKIALRGYKAHKSTLK